MGQRYIIGMSDDGVLGTTSKSRLRDGRRRITLIEPTIQVGRKGDLIHLTPSRNPTLKSMAGTSLSSAGWMPKPDRAILSPAGESQETGGKSQEGARKALHRPATRCTE